VERARRMRLHASNVQASSHSPESPTGNSVPLAASKLGQRIIVYIGAFYALPRYCSLGNLNVDPDWGKEVRKWD